jgi:CBS domain-containing protein
MFSAFRQFAFAPLIFYIHTGSIPRCASTLKRGLAMKTPISAIMTRQAVVGQMNDTVESVEKRMAEHNLSFLPIVDPEGKTFGVISLRDIAHFHQSIQHSKWTRAWEMCTYRAEAVSPDLTVEAAARMMLDKKIHHIVVAEDKIVHGIVSTLDVLQHYVTNMNNN